ncbi:MAG TPA: hypothetical protein VGC61_07530 [Pyrinomonadaceae bacterium]
MTEAWTPQDTTTHQDHVIAHVLGATFLGYFVFDEALYILLDIGFVWTILLDGEMGLLPHPVAINELEVDGTHKDEIKADIDLLLKQDGQSDAVDGLLRLQAAPIHCQIEDVSFLSSSARRRLIITGAEASLAIETSLATAEIKVMALDDEKNEAGEAQESRLEDVARNEHEYLHERLREDLGREPTEAELDEWLRQHTEGY